GRYNGPAITAYRVPDALRAERAEIPLAAAALSASSGQAALAHLVDGDRATWWHTEDLQQAGDFVEVDLPAAQTVCAVGMELGEEPKFAARDVRLEMRRSGAWVRPPWLEGRPRVEAQIRPASQLLLVARPAPAEAVRLSLAKNSG